MSGRRRTNRTTMNLLFMKNNSFETKAMNDFTHSVLGHTGLVVHRLGLSASYRPGKKTVHAALDASLVSASIHT